MVLVTSKRKELVLKNYTTDNIRLENNIWKNHTNFKDFNRLWLPINLRAPSRSSLTVYNTDNWISTVFWFATPDTEIPAYYWIECKEGKVTTNYLPVRIRKMLNCFQDIYKLPSTMGVVFKVEEDKFWFRDLKTPIVWELYENKIKKMSPNGKILGEYYFNVDCFLME